MTDQNNEPRDNKEEAGSQHLNDAITAFRQGLKSFGLFCSEEAIPAAGKTVKDGLGRIKDLADELGKTVDEALKKTRGRSHKQ